MVVTLWILYVTAFILTLFVSGTDGGHWAINFTLVALEVAISTILMLLGTPPTSDT